MYVDNIKIELILPVLVAFIFHSCEYEPTEVYQRQANKYVAPPEIQIVELNLNNDTIYLYSDMAVNFRFISTPQEIKAIIFYIDSIKQKTVYSDSGIFDLPYNDLESGTHTLLIEIYTASGTGSIADHIGMEAFIFSKTWTIIVAKQFSYTMESAVYNGFLKLSWNECVASNFEEYILYRCDESGAQTEIKRLTASEFIDSSYVGEGGGYAVEASLQNGKILEWGNIELPDCIPDMLYYITETNQSIVKWQKNKFYKAIDSYVITQYVSYGRIHDKTESINGPADTVHNIINALFGDNVKVILRVIPKWNNLLYESSQYYMFKSEFSFIQGYSFLCNNENIDYRIYQVKDDEFVYVSNQDSIIRYSVSKKQVTGSLGYVAPECPTGFSMLRASPSGKYLTAYVNCDEDVILISSDNFDDYSVRNLKHLTDVYYFPAIPISDNGIGIINNRWNKLYIYDFNSDVLLAQFNGKMGLRISSNSDYIFLRDDSLRLVQFKDSTLINIWSESQNITNPFYEFDPFDTNRAVFWDGLSFSVRQCDNFSIIYEFSLPDYDVLDINYYNQEILTYSEGHLYIRSLSDGSLLKDIPVNFEPDNDAEACFLIDNTIVSAKGIIYFLN